MGGPPRADFAKKNLYQRVDDLELSIGELAMVLEELREKLAAKSAEFDAVMASLKQEMSLYSPPPSEASDLPNEKPVV